MFSREDLYGIRAVRNHSVYHNICFSEIFNILNRSVLTPNPMGYRRSSWRERGKRSSEATRRNRPQESIGRSVKRTSTLNISTDQSGIEAGWPEIKLRLQRIKREIRISLNRKSWQRATSIHRRRK